MEVLAWKEDVNISIKSSSMGHIDATIEGESESWRFTGFYANPMTNRREESWKLLERLSSQSDFPWVVGGDFNEITYEKEKNGAP